MLAQVIWLVLLLQVALVCVAEIVQIQYMSRHCDRTPWKAGINIPKDPVNWPKQTGYAYGELTGLGMQQCFQLGQAIRERYLNSNAETYVNNLPGTYKSTQYKFTSSSVDRTIQSAWSASMALFPFNGPTNDLTGLEALPNRTQPVPVHSNALRNDVIFRGYDKCPTIAQRFESKLTTQQVQDLKVKYADFMNQMYNASGSEYAKDLANFYIFADIVNCQINHNLLNIPELVANIDKIRELGYISHFLYFDRDVQGKLGGGPFVNQVLQNMQLFIANDTEKAPFIHFSGHDSSLQAILAALKLSTDYPELQELPPYGSAIIFELHRNNGQYSVKIVWKRQYDGPFKVYALKSLSDGKTTGCGDACAFETFKSLVTSDAIPNDWCSECGNTEADICLVQLIQAKQTVSTVLAIFLVLTVIAMVGLAAALAIVVLFKRQTYNKL